MGRIGYKCDDCGDEYRGMDPAAYVDGGELCSACYEAWVEQKA